MNLDFTDKGKVKISMVPFLKKAIEEFPELITRSVAISATNRLFDVRPDEERKLLDEERAQAFHHAMAQLLFATIRYHCDVQIMVVFLCTQVKSPDEDDLSKIERLLRYLRGILYLPLVLEILNMSMIQWWMVG